VKETQFRLRKINAFKEDKFLNSVQSRFYAVELFENVHVSYTSGVTFCSRFCQVTIRTEAIGTPLLHNA
jgi:hypothetical protein